MKDTRPLRGARGVGLKGIATVRVPDGTIGRAEVHWYEAHGIGQKELKVKRFLSKRA